MGRDDDGAPAPAPGQVYLPAWRRTYDRLTKKLHQANAQAKELSVERDHLSTKVQHLQSGRRELKEIHLDHLRQIRKNEELRRRVGEADTAVRLGGKELEIQCYGKLLELSEGELEVYKSCIEDLVAENTELKEKLKKFKSQVEIES